MVPASAVADRLVSAEALTAPKVPPVTALPETEAFGSEIELATVSASTVPEDTLKMAPDWKLALLTMPLVVSCAEGTLPELRAEALRLVSAEPLTAPKVPPATALPETAPLGRLTSPAETTSPELMVTPGRAEPESENVAEEAKD